jgi:carbamate kinase
MRAVVALGGNAVVPDGDASFAEQRERIADTARRVAALAADEDVVVTHGNGPQVGTHLLERERTDTPDRPLDVLVAETQAQLGALVQRALDGHLDGHAVTVVTQAVVDPDDPAFDDPTKPVGPWYTEAEAAAREFETRPVGDGDTPYRRVVASPEPTEVVETDEIAALVDRSRVVVCGGGGGVPVVREDGGLRGVAAVVDKDYTSRRIAVAVGAETLIFLTDVSHVYLGYGTDDQRPLDDVSATRLREACAAGEFPEGSMEPKVRACLRFLDAGGDRAIVTTPDRLSAALTGETGTRISQR